MAHSSRSCRGSCSTKCNTSCPGKSSSSAPRSKVNANFPVRIFVKCAAWGVALTGSIAKGRYSYYFCRNNKCRRVKVRKEELEKAFVALLFRV